MMPTQTKTIFKDKNTMFHFLKTYKTVSVNLAIRSNTGDLDSKKIRVKTRDISENAINAKIFDFVKSNFENVASFTTTFPSGNAYLALRSNFKLQKPKKLSDFS
jgi:hypothetical protein